MSANLNLLTTSQTGISDQQTTTNDNAGLDLPFNIEAEQAVLSAILLNNDLFDRISDIVNVTHFYDPVHQAMFDVMQKLIRANKVASPITIKSYLEDQIDTEQFDFAKYLDVLMSEVTGLVNVIDYARIVQEMALRRNLITLAQDIWSTSVKVDVEYTPRHIIEQAERSLFELAETGSTSTGFQRFTDAISAAVDLAALAYQSDSRLSGISTGLSDLDHLMGGLQSSDLIILAGRPGMGKTALVTNIAFNVAKKYRAETKPDGTRNRIDGGIVGFFSLEMSAEQLATRIMAEQASIPSERIRRGKINDDEYGELVEVSRQIQALPLYIDETGGISIAQLAARARRLKRQHGLDLLIVDYLQLLSGSGKRASDSRVQEITEITTGLKALAKELAVPVIALSQLSRQVESREDKRPQLSDLRESGSIEQDADVVMFVFRQEYYLNFKKPVENTPEFYKWQEDMEDVAGKAEVIIAKQRHGPTGAVELQFDSDTTRFSSLAKYDGYA